MKSIRRPIAKLTRPRLHAPVARERLFALLDTIRAHKPSAAVVGPPGAGKTTLVASWLDARSLPGIWYQIDEGDADLATFFYYLAQAAAPFTARSKIRLPLLGAEYLSDVEAFARRFFRMLFERLPPTAVLVLDNYQEVPGGHAIHRTLAAAIGDAPAGITIVLISRTDPPDAFVRLLANETLSLLSWGDLRLTREETRRIAAARRETDEQMLDLLHARCDGWAAGLTLLLQSAGSPAEGAPSGLPHSQQALFDYFAALIFAQASAVTRRFLMVTAHLSQVTVSIARELVPDAPAEQIFEELARRHLFVHRRAGTEVAFSYHALFREFLRAQALRLIAPDVRSAYIRRAAQLLESRGASEEAFELHRQAQNWDGAIRLILDHADALLAQGRSQTVREWIQGLPPAEAEREPWLRYWLGAALIGVNQQDARSQFATAFERFGQEGTHIGSLRAAAGVVSTYFLEWTDWRPLDPWISALERLMAARPAYPNRRVELEVHCSFLIAALYRQPGHPLLSVCVEKTLALLESDLGVNDRLWAATLLLTYCNLANRVELGERVITLTAPLLQQPEVTPLGYVWWCCRLQFFLSATSRYQEMAGPTREAQDMIERHGLSGLRGAVLILQAHEAIMLMGLRDWGAAERVVQTVEAAARPSSPSDLYLAHESRLRLSLAHGQLERAARDAAAAVAHAVATGMVYVEAQDRVMAMEAYAETGRYDLARREAAAVYSLVRGTCLQYFEPEARIVEAYVEHREGRRDRCRALLAQALEQARHTNPQWRNGGRLYSRVQSAMCAEALDAGIEIAYVQELIGRLRLPPPPHAGPAWPWRVRIHTLGRFEVLVEGEKLEFRGKAPKKPLLLIKALLASGACQVPTRALADTVWPEDDGDGAERSLAVALMRLRRLLREHDVLVLEDGCLTLNRACCWVDFIAFEEAVARSDGDSVLRLYTGPFLPAESDQSWSVRQRERLRQKLIVFVQSTAQALEAQREWQHALRLYATGLEADELAEPLYQGSMRCHLALGSTAEGLAAYRRMRQLLSVVLGVAPSAASEVLAADLRRAAGTPLPALRLRSPD